MRFLPFFLLLTLTQIIAGTVTSGGKTRRLFGATIVCGALAIPFFMPRDIPFLRALSSLIAIMTVLRTIDLARENKPRSLLFRIVHVSIPMDTRRFVKAAPQFSARRLFVVLAYAAIAFPALMLLILGTPFENGASKFLMRWGFGLIFVYALTDAIYRLCALAFAAAGYDVYELHRAPILALSVKEFWGERWNRTVSAWFSEHLLRPLARRRRTRVGVIASFVASGALHSYLVSTVASLAMVGLMFSYFVVQGLFVLVEIRFRASTWNRRFARAWTIGLMVATSPLFIEPGLQWIGL